MNKFAERLNECRLAEKLTRTELAKKLNVSTRLISYWENGKRECSFDTLIVIGEILNVSIDYLLGVTDY